MEVVSRRSHISGNAPSNRSLANSLDAGKVKTPTAAASNPAEKPSLVTAQASLNASARSVSVFDPSKHHPPRIDQFGYNKETHKGREVLIRNTKNVLSRPYRVPQWWESKAIRDEKFKFAQAQQNMLDRLLEITISRHSNNCSVGTKGCETDR